MWGTTKANGTWGSLASLDDPRRARCSQSHQRDKTKQVWAFTFIISTLTFLFLSLLWLCSIHHKESNFRIFITRRTRPTSSSDRFIRLLSEQDRRRPNPSSLLHRMNSTSRPPRTAYSLGLTPNYGHHDGSSDMSASEMSRLLAALNSVIGSSSEEEAAEGRRSLPAPPPSSSGSSSRTGGAYNSSYSPFVRPRQQQRQLPRSRSGMQESEEDGEDDGRGGCTSIAAFKSQFFIILCRRAGLCSWVWVGAKCGWGASAGLPFRGRRAA